MKILFDLIMISCSMNHLKPWSLKDYYNQHTNRDKPHELITLLKKMKRDMEYSTYSKINFYTFEHLNAHYL
jgi:hypothetical protein